MKAQDSRAQQWALNPLKIRTTWKILCELWCQNKMCLYKLDNIKRKTNGVGKHLETRRWGGLSSKNVWVLILLWEESQNKMKTCCRRNNTNLKFSCHHFSLSQEKSRKMMLKVKKHTLYLQNLRCQSAQKQTKTGFAAQGQSSGQGAGAWITRHLQPISLGLSTHGNCPLSHYPSYSGCFGPRMKDGCSWVH